jgi:putative DNA primase/helicase
LCAVTELPTGDGDDESIPAAGWNAAISSIKDYDELNPGRPKTGEFDDETTLPATDGGSAGASVSTSDAATTTATQQPESTQGPSGSDVDTDTAALTPTNLKLEAGIGENESVDELTDRQKAAFIWELIKRNDSVHIRIVENDDIYAYDEDTGVWNTDDGDRVLKQAANRALPTGCYGSNVYEQLRSQVEADPHATMYRDDFGLPPGKIAVENGIVDLQKAYQHLTGSGSGSGSGSGDGVDVTDALRDLKPTDYALRRLNCSFDPTADGSEFRSFVGEVVENTMRETTQEYLGTCLFRGHLAEKALMLVGGGANGKSTFLNIIKTCLGKDNISSVTPGDYRNKNAIAKLDSKVANISAEVSGQTLQAESLNKFKNLTGDDDVMVEEKYQTPYQLNYTGGMIFATNEVPDSSHVSDDDFAFWRRWLIVQFPNEFPEGSDKRDPNIDERLQQDEHQSAVLNWMIEGLGRFRENGDQFDNAPSTEETQRTWETWGDSLEYFLNNVAERDESADNISTGEAYAVYKQWCREQGESSVSRHKFTREAKSRDFGYGGGGSTKIRTERESTPVRGYTCFGTSDELSDPVEIVTDETDVTDETAAVASGSIESYGDTDADTDTDTDTDTDADADADDDDADADGSAAESETETETKTKTKNSADPERDRDQDRYEAGDVDAPDSKYQRRGNLKGKLRAADTDEFMTAADLVGAFGWKRETIDATLETLRRDGEIFGSEKTGWRYND